VARDKVKRNVVALCDVPTGREGRRSKSLSLGQAEALLTAAEDSPLHAYIVLSLLIGARTEELRALRWEEVDLDGQPQATPPVPPSISVLRSVRQGGDTKTRKSRRRLAMPQRCVDALRRHRDRLGRLPAGDALVFASATGTELDAHNVRRSFRRVVHAAGLDAGAWTPREMRHSFVSLLSDSGVPLEHISRLVGHSGTAVTEAVYRQQLRPVLEEGATAMDAIFPLNAAGVVTQIVTQPLADLDEDRSASL
jgi:integrase